MLFAKASQVFAAPPALAVDQRGVLGSLTSLQITRLPSHEDIDSKRKSMPRRSTDQSATPFVECLTLSEKYGGWPKIDIALYRRLDNTPLS